MRNRNIPITFRINESENAHLREQVKKSGLNKETFIRKLIMGIDISPRPPDEYRQLLREINAIGNNINQIAHIANSEKHISANKIDEALQMLAEIMTLARGMRYGNNKNMDC